MKIRKLNQKIEKLEAINIEQWDLIKDLRQEIKNKDLKYANKRLEKQDNKANAMMEETYKKLLEDKDKQIDQLQMKIKEQEVENARLII